MESLGRRQGIQRARTMVVLMQSIPIVKCTQCSQSPRHLPDEALSAIHLGGDYIVSEHVNIYRVMPLGAAALHQRTWNQIEGLAHQPALIDCDTHPPPDYV